ncbi:MAG TPA: hypothetical protein VE988_04965, partial [Gemmataceae bacterium]|nr:hypothetical protein [Gemmataceae bacterium]
MPWIVGIDEAGYGPNLGPFVMTSVACRLPQARVKADLWDVFGRVARRHTDPNDTRFVVADSKLVYSPSNGLSDLEHSVHVALHGERPATLAAFVDHVSPLCHEELRREVWYEGTTPLPVAADAAACTGTTGQLNDLAKSLDIHWGLINSVVVCPATFNSLTDTSGSKGAVLASSVVQLLRGLPADGDDVSVFCDKHGGRNTYCGVLQPAFDDGMVMGREEGGLRSNYYVTDRGRRVDITFEPRADANHFCVALASMVSKYLRELFMLEF